MELNREAWNIYFLAEEFSQFNDNITLIESAKKWITTNIETTEYDRIFKKSILEIDSTFFDESVKLDNIKNGIKCMGCAITDILFDKGYDLIHIKIRIISFKTPEAFSIVNAGMINKLVQINGIVIRVGSKRPLLSALKFECIKCKEIITINVENNLYKQPKKCRGSCKSKLFNVMLDNPDFRCRDFQEIKIQDSLQESKMPLVISGILYDELVGSVSPGDIVEIIGVVKAENQTKDLYRLVVQVNNLKTPKSKLFDTEYNEIDHKKMIEMSKSENLLNSLIHSLFPNIFGNEIIKIGLTLALFGGADKYIGDSKMRSEIHILIVGDPGLGKSQMLLSLIHVLPKSNYVCGNSTTTAGLTVSLVHDAMFGDFVAEAGAIVLSDSGVCCIDEFDKVDNHKCLFEVMEEQKVTVAKAGIICTIPARTTIFAATNPKNGHFIIEKSIKENITFEPALLSRFDLIFILIDSVHKEHDMNVSNFILNANNTKIVSKGITEQQQRQRNPENDQSLVECLSDLRSDKFESRYKKTKDTIIYDIEMLRKYILYAKTHASPILSQEARDTLKDFYLSIRKREDISIRSLESMIRLSEAKAKIELRGIVTKEDALFIIQIYTKTLPKERKNIDKKKGPFNEFLSLLGAAIALKGNNMFHENELFSIIDKAEINKPKAEFIELLNHKGILIKKEKKTYKALL